MEDYEFFKKDLIESFGVPLSILKDPDNCSYSGARITLEQFKASLWHQSTESLDKEEPTES